MVQPLEYNKISWEIQNIANIYKIEGKYFENVNHLIAIISPAPIYWGKRENPLLKKAYKFEKDH